MVRVPRPQRSEEVGGHGARQNELKRTPRTAPAAQILVAWDAALCNDLVTPVDPDTDTHRITVVGCRVLSAETDRGVEADVRPACGRTATGLGISVSVLFQVATSAAIPLRSETHLGRSRASIRPRTELIQCPCSPSRPRGSRCSRASSSTPHSA